jgi:MYXO-CTERM domain-containing protein
MRRSLGALVACVIAASGLVVLAGAPASAAPCPRGTGVTVVVDGNQLGGLSTTCVPGGGRSATSAFSAAGVALTYAARQQGFVCRVNGAPANAGCVNASPANAYWSLWTSSGNGGWSYASTGVTGTSVPAGGWVAWSWQGQSAKSAPSVTPQGPAPAPSPKPTATTPTSQGGSSTTAPRPQSSVSPSASAKTERAEKQAAKDETAAKEGKAEPRASASASTASTATSEPSDEQTQATSAASGTPWSTLVGVLAVLVLLGVAGLVAWRRRSSTS